MLSNKALTPKMKQVVFSICHSGKLVVETCFFWLLAIDCTSKKPNNYTSNQLTAAISVVDFTQIIPKLLCIFSNSQASFIESLIIIL